MSARFENFWPGFSFDETIPSYRFLASDLAAQPLVIGSVFGRSTERFNVLFSGECLRSICWRDDHFEWEDGRGTGSAEWFVGIPRVSHHQALWQPLFYFFWADYRDETNVSVKSLTQNHKEYGVSVLMNNHSWGSLARRRFDIAHALSHFVPVHANSAMQAGAPADSQVTYHDVPAGFGNKLSFVSRFTHHLCFENETFPGYLTEKLFDPLIVGSVPLYAGDPLAGEWFDAYSFVDCIDLNAEEIAAVVRSRTEIVEYVARRRETLCRISFEDMESQTRAFHRRILSQL
ncbi:MAG: hypothetical protein HC801_12495 [Nitrospira sp.]|nr:hypothetical protein [Nitrospira sp.]